MKIEGSSKHKVQVQTQIFNKVILYGLQKSQEIVLFQGSHISQSKLDDTSFIKPFSKQDKKQLLEVIFTPFYEHLYSDLILSLIDKYKKELVLKQSIELILNSFQKYVDSHSHHNVTSFSKNSLSILGQFF